MSTDYDSVWKEALDCYFEPFLALLFPVIHVQIDWSRGYESLDKEFQQIVREAELGRRYVDKLVKVWTKEGVECWVLIHVEVQTAHDAEFPKRMCNRSPDFWRSCQKADFLELLHGRTSLLWMHFARRSHRRTGTAFGRTRGCGARLGGAA